MVLVNSLLHNIFALLIIYKTKKDRVSIMASQQTLQEIPPMKKKARKSPPSSKFQRQMETRIKGWLRSPNQKRFKTSVWNLSCQKCLISMTQCEEDSTHRIQFYFTTQILT